MTKKGLDFTKEELKQLKEAQERVAIQDPEHLKRFLRAGNRRFLVFEVEDLIDSLEAIQVEEDPETGKTESALVFLQDLVNVYRSHRLTIASGDFKEETVTAPFRDDTGQVKSSGDTVRVPQYKDDRLTHSERDRCIRQLAREMFDVDPEWSLENTPL